MLQASCRLRSTLSRSSSSVMPFINRLVALILLVIQNIRECHMVLRTSKLGVHRFEHLGRDSSKGRCFPGLFGEQSRYGSKYLATKYLYTLATLRHKSRPHTQSFFCHMFDIINKGAIHVAPKKWSTGGDFRFWLTQRRCRWRGSRSCWKR